MDTDGETPFPYTRAMQLLAQRRYAEGWPLYEARRVHGSEPFIRPIASQPEWRGEPVAGKTIVVCAEQGFGDQLMFGRYLPILKARGAQVVVACDPRVVGSVFFFAGFEVTPFFTDKPLHGADYWAAIGSLPHFLGVDPPPPPVWSPVGITGGGGVGVVARGNPKHWNDAHRSLHGADAERLLRLGRDIQPAAGFAADMTETAWGIGRLGARCWVLLPHEGLDWRWNDGRRSDWYPDFRLFRQPRAGDWASVLDAVEAALQAEGLG